MKLEIGMYVRTKHGVIGKITSEDYTYCKSWTIDTLYYNFDENVDKWTCGVKEYEISKASHNIIDLIKVGDYVNGYKVYYCYCADEDSTGLFIDTEKGRQWLDKPSQIKSIVTKDQFESMSYKVGE